MKASPTRPLKADIFPDGSFPNPEADNENVPGEPRPKKQDRAAGWPLLFLGAGVLLSAIWTCGLLWGAWILAQNLMSD